MKVSWEMFEIQEIATKVNHQNQELLISDDVQMYRDYSPD